MTTSVVETAMRGTYHLAGTDATRLRRLTRQSGLEAENVLSRLAIIRSLTCTDDRHESYVPSQAGRHKEIKGSVLLGRPRQAALVLALIARASDVDFIDIRTELTRHWARGLRLLDEDSGSGDVVRWIAGELRAKGDPAIGPDRRARRAGLGNSLRDELAAAVGRRFPRWPTEVRRLVAMAARLDPSQLDAVAERVAAECGSSDPNAAIGETSVLHLLRDRWGMNRLGLQADDRRVLQELLDDVPIDMSEPALPFLEALGLARITGMKAALTTIGKRLGPEAVHA